MKIIVREKAAADLDALFEWIAQDNPLAATNMVARIVERINLLAATGLAHMGRAGLVRGTRELVEPPYIIVYEVDEDRDECRPGHHSWSAEPVAELAPDEDLSEALGCSAGQPWPPSP